MEGRDLDDLLRRKGGSPHRSAHHGMEGSGIDAAWAHTRNAIEVGRRYRFITQVRDAFFHTDMRDGS